MFLFLNYLFNCRETSIPWCLDLPALGSLPESMRVMLFGFQRALCKLRILTTLTPVHMKALMPWISQQHSLPFYTPAEVFTSQQMTSPLTYFPADVILPALVIRNHGDDTLHQISLGAPWMSLQSDWQGGRDCPKFCGSFHKINHRPHFWPVSLDWLRWTLYTLGQFPLHPTATTTKYQP